MRTLIRLGDKLGIQGIHRIYKNYSEMAGIKVSPHALRRGFAVETTRLYLQTDEDDLLDSYRAHHK